MRILPPLVIFLSFLLVGYQTGASLGAADWLRTGPQTSASLSVPGSRVSAATVLPNGQHSILLIVADDLKSQSPRLESIWMMSYVANNTRLTFLPVYPSLSEPDADSVQSLPDLFRFTSSAGRIQLDPVFLDSLRGQVPWWGSFLLLDRIALTQWVSDAPGVNNLPHAWEDPRAALLGQASLYQDMCWSSSRAAFDPKPGGSDPTPPESALDLREVTQRLPDHVLSSLDRSQLYDEIDAVNEQMGRFSCEFPTLAVPGSIISD